MHKHFLLLWAGFYSLYGINAGAQPLSPGVTNKQGFTGNLYRFPAFAMGTVVFRSGIITGFNINYNITLDQMLVVNQAGDTVALNAPQSINFISFNGSRFYYDKGYLQVTDTAGSVLLGYKQVIIKQVESPATNKQHATPFISRVIFKVNGEPQKAAVQEYYFFSGPDGRFTRADKLYIFQRFPVHRQELNAFLLKNKTNFESGSDLRKLLQFCKTLTVK